jgi:hypothetical protein
MPLDPGETTFMASTLPTFTDTQNTVLNITVLGYGIGSFGVDDLPALRALSSNDDNVIAIVGDAGGGFGGVFWWDAGNVTADDDVSVIAPSDGLAGRWLKRI